MAKWGMTEPEVLKVFGGAAKTLAEGALVEADLRATIGIDDVGIGGVSFRALFQFDQSDNWRGFAFMGPLQAFRPSASLERWKTISLENMANPTLELP